MSAVSSRPVRVLSLQSRTMGHVTYGELMRTHYANSVKTGIDMDFHWSDEGKSLLTRLDIRLSEQRLPGAFIRHRNLDLWRYRAEMAYARMGRRLADRLLQDPAYDVLHFHTQVPALAALPLLQRFPTVITADITSALISRESGNPSFEWTYGLNLQAERRVFAAARRVVFWSQWAYNSFVHDLGLPPEKGAVIPPGVDLAPFVADEWMQARARRAEAGEPVHLLFVGGNFHRKGGPDLLAAFRKAGLANRAVLHLMTAPEMMIEADESQIRIHRGITPYTPEWSALYRAADVFVLPTHYDGLGIAVMEAAAAGLPLVSTDVNAIPELVDEGTSGFLVAPGDVDALADRLTRLVDDASLRTRMGQAARRTAEERFDHHKVFDRLGDVFRDATGR